MADTVRLLLLSFFLLGLPAQADPQSRSFSNWTISDGKVQMVFTIAAREVTRLPAYQFDGDLGRVLLGEVDTRIKVVGTQASACDAELAQIQRAREGYVKISRQWRCADATELAISNQLLFTQAPSHIHFARFHVQGQPGFEKLYTRHQFDHSISLNPESAQDNLSPNPGATIFTYIIFGFEHILIGLDHIAFLLSLMLLARRLRDVIFIVTGFTLGHSITLSLGVLGLATPNLMFVEALIGFTIAIVAAENIVVKEGATRSAALIFASCAACLAILGAFAGIGPPLLSLVGLGLFSWCYLRLSDSEQRARQLRPAVTALFGLVHGFGFASVLLEVGLPQNAIIPALFGFNLGVEFGQVAIVCALALTARLARGLTGINWPRLDPWLNTALCGLGVYWFVQRLYF